MTKRSKKIHARAKKVGAYLVKDSKRQAGGLIYTVAAVRERQQQFGKMGAASGVRRIDPATGEVIEEITLSEIERKKKEEAALEKARQRAGRRRARNDRFRKMSLA